MNLQHHELLHSLFHKNTDLRRLSAFTGKHDKQLGKEGLAVLAAPDMPEGTCTVKVWIITEAGKRLLTTYQVLER